MSHFGHLNFSYDENTDVLTIEGVKYSGYLFRELSSLTEFSGPIQIMGRNSDGSLIVKKLSKDDLRRYL